jgi:hypothetical protein
MFLVEWQTMRAQLLSVLGHWWNGGLSKRLWADQTAVGKSQARTIRRMLQHLQLQLVQAFNGVGSSVRKAIIEQHRNTFRQQFSVFVRIAGFNWSQSISLKWTLFTAVVLQIRSLCIPKKCQHYHSCWWLSSELLDCRSPSSHSILQLLLPGA